jgi:uncharacterized protein (TIGR02145 family)
MANVSIILRSALCIAVCLSLTTCQKETPSDAPSPGPGALGLFGSSTAVNVAGVVLDEAGDPVQDAMVMAGFGSQTTTTDENGVFRLQGIAGYTGLGLVRVSRSGYFPGSRSFVPSGTLNSVRIVLLTRTQVGTVNGASGGQVQTQGATVTFASEGFVRNGAAYTGSVNVYMDHLDPSASDFADRMPGDLVAVQDNNARMLLSYGMVAVELTDNAGQVVELAPGTTAEVRFPITASQQGNAPAQIDLWWYDEQAGHWRHEGTATRQGNEYVGQVSHFSFWNCDVPMDYIQLTGVVNAGGAALSGAVVTVTSTSMGSATDYTGPTGAFGGFVPAGEVLALTVSLACAGGNYAVVHTQQLGVLTTNTNVGTIAVSSPNTTVVSGSVVGCNGQPLAQGYVLANGEAVFANGGQFSFSTCAGGSITLVGIDPVGNVSSAAVTISLSGTVVNAGGLVACAGSSGLYTPGPGVTDQNGNSYTTIILNNGQEWMAENLRSSTYANGDPIPNVTDGNQWADLTTGAWAHYDNNPSYEDPYGKLYNWYAVADPRNVCPAGWHVPTDGEWQQLELALGMPANEVLSQDGDRGVAQNVGGRMKSTGTQYWNAPNTGATNESGFSGLPGGGRSSNNGVFFNLGNLGRWYSASESGGELAWARSLYDLNVGIFRNYGLKSVGLCVRCVRD